MKKYLIFIAFFMAMINSIQAQNWKIGDKIKSPFPTKSHLLVYMPSMSLKCEYGTMLCRAFQAYFKEYPGLDNQIEIQYIVSDTVYNPKMLIAKYNVEVLNYKNRDLVTKYRFKPFDSLNSSAKVYFFDKDILIYKDEKYRAVGTDLKPLEIAIEKHFGKHKPIVPVATTHLNVGDNAPIIHNEDGSVYDYKTHFSTMVSFYPAAFSGVLPPSASDTIANTGMVNWSELVANGHPQLSAQGLRTDSIGLKGQLMIQAPLREALTCSYQPRFLLQLSFDKSLMTYGGQTKVFAVTNTRSNILSQWKTLQATPSVAFLNDADFALAQQFNSLNKAGYCKRSLFIIDQKGIVRYADYHFDINDEPKIKALLLSIHRK